MRKILVVDPEGLVGSMYKRLLEDLGHRVETASTPEQAMAGCGKGGLDLIFIDVEQRRYDISVKLIKEMKSANTEAEIYVLLASPHRGSIEELSGAGASKCYAKPMNILELRGFFEEVLMDNS